MPQLSQYLSKLDAAPAERTGVAAYDRAASFQTAEPSALWLSSLLEKQSANRVLLAPVHAGKDASAAIAQVVAGLARRHGKRLLVINCDPDTRIPSEALEECTFADVASDLRAEPLPAARKARFVTSTCAELESPCAGLRFEDLLRELSLRLNLVVCIGKPFLAGPESAIVARFIPHVVVVVESGRTTVPQLDRLMEIARRESFAIVGGVLAQRKRWIPRWVDRLCGWQ